MNKLNISILGTRAELEIAYRGTRLLREKLDEIYTKRIEITLIAMGLSCVSIIVTILFKNHPLVVTLGCIAIILSLLLIPLSKLPDLMVFESMIQKIFSIDMEVKASGGIDGQNPNITSNETKLGKKANRFLKKQELTSNQLEMFNILKIEWEDSLGSLVKTCKSL